MMSYTKSKVGGGISVPHTFMVESAEIDLQEPKESHVAYVLIIL